MGRSSALTNRDFELIWQKYTKNMPIRTIADHINRSPTAVANAIKRIKLYRNPQYRYRNWSPLSLPETVINMALEYIKEN